MIASLSTLRGPNARLANNGLRDAQNVCALTKVSTVLTFTKRDLQFQKPSVRLYKVKLFFCLPASNLAPKMGRRRPAWQLARSSSSVARQDNSCVILNKLCLFLVKLNPEFSS